MKKSEIGDLIANHYTLTGKDKLIFTYLSYFKKKSLKKQIFI